MFIISIGRCVITRNWTVGSIRFRTGYIRIGDQYHCNFKLWKNNVLTSSTYFKIHALNLLIKFKFFGCDKLVSVSNNICIWASSELVYANAIPPVSTYHNMKALMCYLLVPWNPQIVSSIKRRRHTEKSWTWQLIFLSLTFWYQFSL